MTEFVLGKVRRHLLFVVEVNIEHLAILLAPAHCRFACRQALLARDGIARDAEVLVAPVAVQRRSATVVRRMPVGQWATRVVVVLVL